MWKWNNQHVTSMGQRKSLSPQQHSNQWLSHAGDMLIIIFLFSQKGNGFKIRSVGNNLTCKETRTLRTRNQTNVILAVSSAGLEKNLEFHLILWAGISHNLLAQVLHFLPGPLPIVYFTVKVNCKAKTTTCPGLQCTRWDFFQAL